MNEGVAASLAALTLIVGGGLATIGILSLLNLNVFKSRQKNLAALAMGLALLVATEAVFLTGGSSGRYFSGQKVDVTDCEYVAEGKHPLERRSNPGIVRDEIKHCMDRLGYEWSDGHEHCREAPLATNEFCYLPKDRFGRVLVAFQMKFE
jgi:hypothetical protein